MEYLGILPNDLTMMGSLVREMCGPATLPEGLYSPLHLGLYPPSSISRIVALGRTAVILSQAR